MTCSPPWHEYERLSADLREHIIRCDCEDGGTLRAALRALRVFLSHPRRA